MLELQGLSKRYGPEVALDDVSLVVRDDEYLTLLGPSGSGKSTLLRLIAGLEDVSSGQIRIDEMGPTRFTLRPLDTTAPPDE